MTEGGQTGSGSGRGSAHKPRSGAGARIAAYAELTKPGITFFVMVTAVTGYLMGALPGVVLADFFHVALGTGLCTGGALALNQYVERVPDGLMHRTRSRPIPSGKVSPARARVFGWVLVLLGAGHLWFWLGWVPAGVAVVSAVLYNGVYTPMKLRSPLATPVGAVPGALPALIGWSAATGTVDARGMVLVGILFLWQLIHVLALGWNLREDYARAGFHLIPPGPPRLISGLMVGYAAALLPMSVVPAWMGMSGGPYLVSALLLGTAMIAATVAFSLEPTRRRCRRVFLGSLLYHPLLLGMMVAGAL